MLPGICPERGDATILGMSCTQREPESAGRRLSIRGTTYTTEENGMRSEKKNPHDDSNPGFVTKELCEAYGVFLIADEIAVGFGRTGTMFACEQADVTPDFLCLSKGITGGYLPLSVVMTSDDVYSAFYCDYSEGKSFLDSHSYTGNALACMAANATLDIFENEHILESNRVKIDILAALLQRFEDLPNVLETRQRGMIAAVELKGYDPSQRIGLKIYRYALQNGVLLRPLGNVVYFMPPYIVTEEQLIRMTDVAYEAIKRL